MLGNARMRRMLIAGTVLLCAAEAVADLMFELVGESGAAMVMVTHDAALAARTDRQVRMSEGQAEDQAQDRAAGQAGDRAGRQAL